MGKIFNFSAGPSMLPKEVMHKIQEELDDWKNLKISVMEISHRSDEFNEMVEQSEYDFRNLLNVPNNYKVLFCHGGGRTQFSSVPMNLLGFSSLNAVPDYIDSGYWSRSAAQEAEKYCSPNLINVNVVKNGIQSIKKMNIWEISHNSAYLHYCPNETIDGITIRELPNFGDDLVVVGDFSSILLSEPLNVSQFGIIYAAAQKNIGISGLTVVIVREDLLDRAFCQIPATLQYSILAKNRSMFNTPSTFSWYIAGLVFQWIRKKGGVLEMSVQNQKKANLLYKTIDDSDCYYNNVSLGNRSYMNVPFYLYNSKLNEIFLNESKNVGLYFLKGHRIVGGMRASLYNAMPLEGVETLIEFMIYFEKKYG